MSELKARTARSIADEEERLELGADCPIEPAQVYLKYEADKVIADKDAKILALDAEVFKQKHHAKLFFDERNYAETQLRKQKFKRCLAMAKLCRSEWAAAIFIHEKGGTDKQAALYMKWEKHWLALADKFKEEV